MPGLGATPTDAKSVMYFQKSDANTHLRIYTYYIRVWEENVTMDSPTGI